MAIFSTSRKKLHTNNNDQYEVVMIAGQSGPSVYVPNGNLNASSDAFGRLRISQPHTLFDNSFRYGEDPTKWRRKETGTTTHIHNANEGVMELGVGTANGDEIIHETAKVFQYQPGKSLLVMNTFCLGAAVDNVRMRVGYFGRDNGIYVERNGSDAYIVKRSSVTGSIVNTEVSQSQWNVDKLDGTGPSGLRLDLTKSQIFWTDIEWLGVGSVRTGFVINGQYIITHIFHHANDIETTYMTTATLPIRYEVTNTAASAGATMKQICSTVISEGGYNAVSLTRSQSTPLTGKQASDSDFTPMVSLRLRPGQTDAVVVPSEISVYGLQQAAYKYAIIKQPTLTGASWQVQDSASAIQYDISATSYSGGTIVKEGFFVGDTKGGAQRVELKDLNHSLQLTRGIIDSDSAGDIFTLAVLATTNNDDAVAAITWQQHT
jgi:hypothetical protein